MVFQSPVLFPWRTVLDNVLLPVDVQRLGLMVVTGQPKNTAEYLQATGRSLDELAGKGYQFVRVDALLDPPPVARP